MVTYSELCQLNGGCMGCCGHDFISKDLIKLSIHKNTLEFKDLNPKNKSDLLKFRDRSFSSDLRDGVCRNLIEGKIGKKTGVHCPLHPSLNKNDDLRIGHCDTNYLCKTAKHFEKWSKKKKDLFLKFVKSKKLDDISYSIMMDKNKLLEEFDQFCL